MEKLALLIFFFSFLAHAQKLEFLKSRVFEATERVQNHRYGGISGLSFSGGFLWAISDDRGQFGSPRIYKHSLSDLNIKILNELTVGEIPQFPILDLEALFRFKDGKFLFSSEGDLNKKPRVMPFVKYWDEKKKWEEEIVLPEDLMAEKTGQQTKGLQNNSAFEALAISEDEKNLFLISEVSSYQNQKSECEFLEYSKEKKRWNLKSRKVYLRDKPPEDVVEIMRGVSEALAWKRDQILVLERYVRIQKPKLISMGAELFSVDFTNGIKKKKLLTLEGDLAGNWEGMTWGPNLSDGRKLLILVTDNNFEKLTPTRYLFYAFTED